jgi:hypothetical protein
LPTGTNQDNTDRPTCSSLQCDAFSQSTELWCSTGNPSKKESFITKGVYPLYIFSAKMHKEYVFKTYFSAKMHKEYVFKTYFSAKNAQRVCFQNILFGQNGTKVCFENILFSQERTKSMF